MKIHEFSSIILVRLCALHLLQVSSQTTSKRLANYFDKLKFMSPNITYFHMYVESACYSSWILQLGDLCWLQHSLCLQLYPHHDWMAVGIQDCLLSRVHRGPYSLHCCQGTRKDQATRGITVKIISNIITGFLLLNL